MRIQSKIQVWWLFVYHSIESKTSLPDALHKSENKFAHDGRMRPSRVHRLHPEGYMHKTVIKAHGTCLKLHECKNDT